MLLFEIILLLYLNVFIATSDVCQTPLLQQGTCKPITQCSPLYDLLQENASRIIVSFLKKSECGREGRTPKVCCPEVIPEFGNVNKSNLLPNSELCGSFRDNKIIGGNGTFIDQFPFNALLNYKGNDEKEKIDCGGTLISERYILTAAHCIRNNLVSVRLGEHTLGTNPDCEDFGVGLNCADHFLEVPVERTIIHERYDPADPNHYNDIALVRLKNKITFSDYIKPVCLHSPIDDNKPANYSGKTLLWAGWGISLNQVPNSSKQRAEVIIYDNDRCAKILNLKLDDNQICGLQKKSFKSCIGDSGGALSVFSFESDDYRYFATGVLSIGSCDLNQPLVFTKVDKYVQWIISTLEP